MVYLNTEVDYLFLLDRESLESFLGGGGGGGEGMGMGIRRLAVPVGVFEGLVQIPRSIVELLEALPGVEEVVLVVNEVGEKGEWEGKELEFGEVGKGREFELRSSVLVGLCMQVYQPWMAFEGLCTCGMVEGALGRLVESLIDGRVVRFKVREVRVGEGRA
jgi:hypothetical protein